MRQYRVFGAGDFVKEDRRGKKRKSRLCSASRKILAATDSHLPTDTDSLPPDHFVEYKGLSHSALEWLLLSNFCANVFILLPTFAHHSHRRFLT